MVFDYEQAWAEARDEPPFANGTEGYGWMDDWCHRCLHDKGTRDGTDEQGCQLVSVALMGRTPIQWLDQKRHDGDGRLVPYGIADQYHCIMFRPEDDDGGGEPTPIPDPPGQLTLLPREPYERPARMLASITTPVEVGS